MPRTEVIRSIPKFHVDLSDLVEKEESGMFKDEQIDHPVTKKSVPTPEKPKHDKNIIIKSHPDVSEDYIEWVKVLYSADWADLLTNQLQSEHTPFALCLEILDKVKIVHNKKVLVISAIEFIPVLIDKFGIKKEDIFFLDEGQKDATMDSIKREVIITADMIPEQNILNMNEVKKMKFDFIVANPPYDSLKALHQQFFNLSFSLLADDGAMAFIQPANPYLNKKETRRKTAELEMQEIIRNHVVSVDIKNEDVFENALIGSKLAITVATKKKTNGQFIAVYPNNKQVVCTLDDVNQMYLDKEIYHSMRQKVMELCAKNGTLYSHSKISGDKAMLPKVRGHAGNIDFNTFIPDRNEREKIRNKRNAYNYGSHDFGVKLNDSAHLENFYSYLETDFARFCLALSKMDINLTGGELKTVPFLDFSKNYTDDELFSVAGFNEQEIQVIRNIIPDFYNRRA